MLVKDQLGRQVEISTRPKRVISLVPSITELIVSLGLEEQLVGVTKFCIYPKHIRETARVVGGTKSVHYDRIEELRPDLILCNKEENTPEMVEQLEKLAPVWVSDIVTIENCLEMIREFGNLFDSRAEAIGIEGEIRENLKEFNSFIKSCKSVKVAYLIWKDPLMAAGGGTYINHILEINNFKNVISPQRYPEISDKALKEADIILLSSEPYPFKQSHAEKFSSELGIPCVLVDGSYFSWYGSRLVVAFNYFRSLRREISDLV